LPHQPFICFAIDGRFYYHIARLETACRHAIVGVAVIDDSGLDQKITLNEAACSGKACGQMKRSGVCRCGPRHGG